MTRPFASRTLLAISGVLVLLLAALAAVQYRWSTRVAAADAQREREHLNSSATLFANEFNAVAVKAAGFLQNDAWTTLQSRARLAGVPRLIGELYYLDFPEQGASKVQRLGADGFFAPSPLPEWAAISRCTTAVITRPLALVSPVYDVSTLQTPEGKAMRIMRAYSRQSGRCFVARLNDSYLRDELVPQLVRQSFGDTSAREYDFAVISRDPNRDLLYGARVNADLRQPFFSVAPIHFPSLTATTTLPSGKAKNTFFVQRLESTVVVRGAPPLADLLGDGVWELQVAHKGVPLEVGFERARRRDLLLSLLVEGLLIAAVVFLVIAVRRMQRLADQKMQFVVAVSHELRTPVSAISMLSRNQADGLVTGERVKQYGELIHHESRRLNDMVEQTLQYAGIHSGLRRPASHQVDVRRLIEEAVAARREELQRRGFEVEMTLASDLPPVLGDAALLRTAFDNLLSNAEKYAEDGHWIRIRAGYSAPEKEVVIGVEDRGPGIDPVDQTDIFEPFCRGQAAVEAQIPGSGLGLSLVRSAAEAHHGTVTLVSAPGRGSTFTLHLPV